MGEPLSNPPFGQADLSNCELEQIHLAQSIQPHGALMMVRESDGTVVQASTNAAAFLGLAAPVLGQTLEAISAGLAEAVRPHLGDPLDTIPRAIRCRIGGRLYDGLLHRPPGEGLIVELEHAGAAVPLADHLAKALQAILAAPSVRALCDEAARVFKTATGYDRVMIYRFDEQGHGQIFSEQREPELEPYLGNWYPASDIPQIARRLYERNRVRVLVDVAYAPVLLVPRYSPITGRDLDMSLCALRSMSPIHIQYLKNMGVGATLVASLMVGGKLWGLVSCHHYVPRAVSFEVRAVCELLAEAVATRIAALESFVQAQAELSVRRLEQRMIEAIAREGDWRMALFDNSQALLVPVGATGAALLYEGQILTTGDVPGTPDLREVGAWLDAKPREPLVATAALGSEAPELARLAPVAAGLLAAPVSNTPGEWLIWFRPERVRTVTWGGDPLKPVEIGDSPTQLSPRRSFAKWHQLVEGTCDSWSAADLTAARLISDTVTDVVLQFRAVSVLIAQHQLDTVRSQVVISDQPAIIADADGRILLCNPAFDRLLPNVRNDLARLDDLAPLFANLAEMRQRLRDLTLQHRTWRGEVRLAVGDGDAKQLLVRADPVFSSPGKVLGFVLLFMDMTERKAAEAARSRFQEGVIDRNLLASVRLDPKADHLYRTLLSPVVENAQLAALEITDGLDTARMAEMLASVQASVQRAAEVLAHLASHSIRAETQPHDPRAQDAHPNDARVDEPSDDPVAPPHPIRPRDVN
ncbi:putative PAS/PAC sensor protein [Rhodovulum sp. PH10]|uniref:GAF domain-containing protein n=1 Tax=Rhodovulum sp. PH10 TaxID=1187851 RepID=UPI00027C2194|nr:GAF domain-containing protein [Rhodovulum sp. PH10]EJW12803.1 putative PAS/PAC sensor protein [Rhodovulum sp. PH10]